MSSKFYCLFLILLPNLIIAQEPDSAFQVSEKFQLSMHILPAKTASLSWKNIWKNPGGFFFLERRTEGGIFEIIVTMRSADSSREYHATDEKPFPGINHYRIKFVDGLGKTSYSQSVAGDLGPGSFCRFYPNPADDHVIVQSNVKTVVQIFAPNGSQILTQNLEKGLVPIDISSFSRGMYILNFINTETRASVRNILYKN